MKIFKGGLWMIPIFLILHFVTANVVCDRYEQVWVERQDYNQRYADYFSPQAPVTAEERRLKVTQAVLLFPFIVPQLYSSNYDSPSGKLLTTAWRESGQSQLFGSLVFALCLYMVYYVFAFLLNKRFTKFGRGETSCPSPLWQVKDEFRR